MALADLLVGCMMLSRGFLLCGIDEVLRWSAGLAEVEAGGLRDTSGSGQFAKNGFARSRSASSWLTDPQRPARHFSL